LVLECSQCSADDNNFAVRPLHQCDFVAANSYHVHVLLPHLSDSLNRYNQNTGYLFDWLVYRRII
jgi:hypothetical protein